MKLNRFLCLVLLLAATMLVACGTDDNGDDEVGVAKADGKAGGNLTISNWALYIDKKTLPEFEDKTGVKVKYVEEINGYDEFFAKTRLQLRQGDSAGAR